MTDKENLGDRIKNGEVGVLPTDTLYGLVGSALLPQSVEKIYSLKKREPSKPLIVLISKISDLEKFSVILDDKLENFLKSIWPGPVSIVLPCADFDYLDRGTGKIAFRLPAKEDLRQLISESGPLVAPSANPESASPAKNISEAKKYFGEGADFYIDGGEFSGEPSSLVEYKNGKFVILRKGAGLDKLSEFLL